MSIQATKNLCGFDKQPIYSNELQDFTRNILSNLNKDAFKYNFNRCKAIKLKTQTYFFGLTSNYFGFIKLIDATRKDWRIYIE